MFKVPRLCASARVTAPSHHLRTGSSAVTHGCSQASLCSERTGLWISEIERTIRIFGSSKLRTPRRPASFVAKLFNLSTRGDCKGGSPNESDEAVHWVWRGSPMTPQPTLKWYNRHQCQQESFAPLPVCASVQPLSPYYQSVSLLGEAGVATAIEPEEDSKLWSSGSVPTSGLSLMNNTRSERAPQHFLQFLPEVSFDRYGWFGVALGVLRR